MASKWHYEARAEVKEVMMVEYTLGLDSTEGYCTTALKMGFQPFYRENTMMSVVWSESAESL